MIKNLSEIALNKVYEVSLDSITHKEQFYKGVSLSLHLLSAVDL